MATRFNKVGVLAALLFLYSGMPASSSPDPEWFTRVWQIDDGLLDNDVNGIVQDTAGYLWLVTPVGLMRFDGVHFNPFPIENFTGRIGSHVRLMLRGKQGVLWTAFDDGKIIGLSPDFSILSLDDNALPKHVPTALANDGIGALWLAYSDAIFRAQNGKVTSLTANAGVPPGPFRSLSADGAGNIWLAKGNQISCYQNGKFDPIASGEGLQCLGAAHRNAVWLSANSHLFFVTMDGQMRDCGAFQDRSNARTTVLLEDHNGVVWIATEGNGLFQYRQLQFDRIKTSHSSIVCLKEDHEGNIWAGTGGGGLDRITPSIIKVEALEHNHVQTQIQSICQDANGVLWGATQNGALVTRAGSSWKPALSNVSFAGTMTCVAAGKSGVWAGTRDGKLLNISSASDIRVETSIARAPIRGILPASDGDLWIVGADVLQRWHEGQLSNIELPQSAQRVLAIAEGASGNIWIGGGDNLFRFDGTNLVNESSALNISGSPICCLYCTKDGALWIGSRAGGLLRLKDGRASQIGLGQGLVNDNISQIIADGHGWLWFASKHGVFKLRQEELDRAMEDPGLRLRPIVYGKNAGLISQEAIFSLASPFVLPRALLDRDGNIELLMHAGVVVADPNTSLEKAIPPPVLLTQAAVDGRVIASDEGAAAALNRRMELPPSHRRLEFDFVAFHFRDPENLHFRYQLAGYDNGWTDSGAERKAAYSRLAAGDYQFRVEASVEDGPWSDPPATLDFKVVPFFWQTWWFRLGIIFVFTVSVIVIVRYVSYRRLRLKLRAAEQRAAVERERGRIARDIHDDLGNRLTEIQLLTGLAQRKGETPQKANLHINEISSAARQATDALDEIVWAINPRNDTLPHLIDYLGQFTTDYLRTAGIRCRVNLPENPPAKAVSAEVRHNLFLAIKESLNNIVRHSSASEVALVIGVSENSLSVTIEDDGRGFNEETQKNGANGLENMRQRIAEIEGQFHIQSKPGAGASISFNGQWLAEK